MHHTSQNHLYSIGDFICAYAPMPKNSDNTDEGCHGISSIVLYSGWTLFIACDTRAIAQPGKSMEGSIVPLQVLRQQQHSSSSLGAVQESPPTSTLVHQSDIVGRRGFHLADKVNGKNNKCRKMKMDSYEALREFHRRYATGLSDEELKHSWQFVQESNFNPESASETTANYQVHHLREDFDRAVKCDSLGNAEKIQEWFKTQPYLPQPSLGLIHKFLWASKEDAEKCKKRLLRYYTLRGTDDELFGNRDPCSQEAKHVYETSHFMCLPGLTPELYRVTFSALKDANPDVFIAKFWLKHVFYMADLRVKEDFCMGDIIVYDLKGFTMQHLLKFPVTLAKKMVVASENALPSKIKQIHMFNAPPFIDKILGLFKPFMKEKIAKRIFTYTDNYDEIFKYVPKDIWPKEYGGKAGTLQELSDKWVREFERNREWFINEEKTIKRLCMEAKREGKLFVDSGELFGLEGSFKKLEID